MHIQSYSEIHKNQNKMNRHLIYDEPRTEMLLLQLESSYLQTGSNLLPPTVIDENDRDLDPADPKPLW